jgi:trans-L-3-hydroxyproline dehydratase
MTTDLQTQTIVRHYSAATREEVEQAYQDDARKAARAGYVPVTHTWRQHADGLLLAVSFSGPVTRPDARQPALPQERPQQPRESLAADRATSEPGTIIQQNGPPARSNDQRLAYTPVQRIADIDRAEATTLAHERLPGAATASNGISHETVLAPDEFVPQPTESTDQSVPQHITVTLPAATPEPAARKAKMTIQALDLHTAGEPLRLIRSGYPEVPMLPVLERRQWIRNNADFVRRALMFEPRGHRDMYGAILLPPYSEYADITVLFMHNEGYSTMCGHGVIAITTGLIEEGLFPATQPVTTIRYETPAGIVAANAATVKQDDGSWAVRGVRFTNVPSYLAAQSLSVRPDGIELHGSAAQYGALSVDLAFGGAYYGIVNAAQVGLRVVPEQADELRRVGAAITDVLRRDHTPAHPSDPDLSFVYGTIIVDLDPRSSPDGKGRDAHIRNATIFAEAELDRSPCGSGTSAILAQLHARGRIGLGREIINAGITGEHFLGRVDAETALGPYAAVSTSVEGTAYVTGYSTFVVDSRDPLGDGFLLE